MPIRQRNIFFHIHVHRQVERSALEPLGVNASNLTTRKLANNDDVNEFAKRRVALSIHECVRFDRNIFANKIIAEYHILLPLHSVASRYPDSTATRTVLTAAMRSACLSATNLTFRSGVF